MSSPLIQIRLTTPSFEKISPGRQAQSPPAGIARFELHEGPQLFARKTERFPAVAMCVSNPDRSAYGINAETYPRLQPRFSRLRAMISQYFTRPK
jgi:hypothetical protein